MKVTYRDSLTYKMTQRIQALPGNVVLREDVADMAARRQVSYALNNLIKQDKLVRMGYAVYAKVYQSKYLEGMPVLKGGFAATAREALDRLAVTWEPGSAEQEYNTRRTTQVPVRAIVKLKSRFRRKLTYKNMTLQFERPRYAVTR